MLSVITLSVIVLRVIKLNAECHYVEYNSLEWPIHLETSLFSLCSLFSCILAVRLRALRVKCITIS
jgi:hypothetical protein